MPLYAIIQQRTPKDCCSRILSDSNVPVVPIAIRGLWGSLFSRADGLTKWRKFRNADRRVGVAVGPATTNTDPDELFDCVAALRGDAR